MLARTSLLAAVAAAAAPPFIEPDISPLALVRSWCGWLTRSRLRSRAAALVAIVDANAAISMARNPGVVFACVGFKNSLFLLLLFFLVQLFIYCSVHETGVPRVANLHTACFIPKVNLCNLLKAHNIELLFIALHHTLALFPMLYSHLLAPQGFFTHTHTHTITPRFQPVLFVTSRRYHIDLGLGIFRNKLPLINSHPNITHHTKPCPSTLGIKQSGNFNQKP